MSSNAWFLLVLLSLLWGGSFFFVEVALGSVGPLTVVLCRVGLAAAILIALLYARGIHLPVSWRYWQWFFVMGLLNNVVPFSLIAYGQVRIDSGTAAILNATTPLFTIVVAHVFTRDEKLNALKLVGIALGVAGVALLMGPDAVRGFDLKSLAQVAVLAAALSYACAGVYGRRLSELPNLTAATGMLSASTVLMIPMVFILEPPVAVRIDATAIAALAGLAALSTAIAYFIYFRLLAMVGATNLLLVTFLIPVSALLLGMTFLGERPSASAIAGMALIFAGLAVVDGRLFRGRRR